MIRKKRGLRKTVLSIFLIPVLMCSLALPAFATAEEDTLVQCDSAGVVTDNTEISGVTLPMSFVGSDEYYCTVDAAVCVDGSALKTLTGLVPDDNGEVSISLGAVTNYEYDTVYEIHYRGHYYIYGEDTELIGGWQSSGLYFRVEPAAITGALLSSHTEDFDLYSPSDVNTTITWNDADNVTDITVSGESIGSHSWSVTPVDSDTATLTVTKEFLVTKAAGSLSLTVSFNRGGTEKLVIDIKDSTPPSISPACGTFDLNSPDDVSTKITWNSASDVEDVKCDGDSLTSSDDYTVNGSTLRIKSDYLDGLSLTDGDLAEFTIDFDTGDSVTFAVDIEDGYTPGDDASLSSLLVGGVAVSGFDSDTLEYDVTLPYGTEAGSAAAAISAIANDPKASVSITQAAILPGSASIYVVAEDTVAYNTYIVNLTLEDAPSVSVTNITVTGTGGVSSVAAGNTLQMKASVLPDTATDVSVIWSVTDETGSAYIDESGVLTGVTEGTVIVKATAKDGSGVYGEKEITVTSASANTHAIVVTNDGNGTGSAGYSSAAKGTTVTLSSSPSSGYHFKEWQAVAPTSLSITSNTFTMPDTAVVVKAVFEADSADDCTVTFYNANSVYALKTVSSGGSISSTNWPANPVKSGYTFNGWNTSSDGSGSAFTSSIAVSENITVYAQWTKNSSSGGSSSGSTQSSYLATVSGGSSSKLTVTVDEDEDSASAAVSDTQSKLIAGGKSIVISMPEIDDVTDYVLGIPVSGLSTNSGGSLTLNTGAGKVTLPSNMLTGTDAATGDTAQIELGLVDSSELSDKARNAVGDRPVVSLSLYIDGEQTDWNNPKAPVTVSIPYTPAARENLKAIVIWYIDGDGNLNCVKNGYYDSKTGTVTFKTTHFSLYAVGYNSVSFSDVSGSSWYADYVDYLAARGIVGGNNGTYNSGASITRAEFVTILARMSGDDLSGYALSSFKDVASSDWYAAAAQWAYASGIATGSDGKFNPNAAITREQMTAMLYRYAEYAGTVSNAEGMSAREFTDYESISTWAQGSVQWAVNNGIISGNTDGSFASASNATRAQAAKMIAVMLQNMVGSL